ncbi:MAG: hypothetical protein HFE82_06045 [Erysipelotrichaceae bacterium]|nr:hypothetical protein [Erysipelotrichaceae bacterium]
MKKLYIKVGFIIIGLITLSLGFYGVNNFVRAEGDTQVFSIYFNGDVDQIQVMNMKIDGVTTFPVFLDNSMNNAGPFQVLANPDAITVESQIPGTFHLEFLSKDYNFHPNIIILDPADAANPIDINADYDPNHLTEHMVHIKDSGNTEKTSFANDETANVSFTSAYPNYVVYYSLQDEGTWQQANGGSIDVSAISDQAHDRVVEYRFAGYYDNEPAPTIDELQDAQYLKTAVVHFEAEANGDPNDDTTGGQPPVDPGNDDTDPDAPDPDNTGNTNPDDPNADDNDPTNPNPDLDDTDPDDTDPNNDNNNPDNDNNDTNLPNNDDDDTDPDNDILTPDNSNEGNDTSNPDNEPTASQPDNLTGANTGDYTNAVLWITAGAVGYFCVVYPIRKRMGEQNK